MTLGIESPKSKEGSTQGPLGPSPRQIVRRAQRAARHAAAEAAANRIRNQRKELTKSQLHNPTVCKDALDRAHARLAIALPSVVDLEMGTHSSSACRYSRNLALHARIHPALIRAASPSQLATLQRGDTTLEQYVFLAWFLQVKFDRQAQAALMARDPAIVAVGRLDGRPARHSSPPHLTLSDTPFEWNIAAAPFVPYQGEASLTGIQVDSGSLVFAIQADDLEDFTHQHGAEGVYRKSRTQYVELEDGDDEAPIKCEYEGDLHSFGVAGASASKVAHHWCKCSQRCSSHLQVFPKLLINGAGVSTFAHPWCKCFQRCSSLVQMLLKLLITGAYSCIIGITSGLWKACLKGASGQVRVLKAMCRIFYSWMLYLIHVIKNACNITLHIIGAGASTVAYHWCKCFQSCSSLVQVLLKLLNTGASASKVAHHWCRCFQRCPSLVQVLPLLHRAGASASTVAHRWCRRFQSCISQAKVLPKLLSTGASASKVAHQWCKCETNISLWRDKAKAYNKRRRRRIWLGHPTCLDRMCTVSLYGCAIAACYVGYRILTIQY